MIKIGEANKVKVSNYKLNMSVRNTFYTLTLLGGRENEARNVCRCYLLK